ncbi:hypothetical protein FDP41_012935 [Naegleria fowleri]|uniref:PITH domain-containing protein n=1 Tax=Naegleria fowleri TaxID=5763 RepID=A0A6A5BVB0_NAEFO|nr:uncharacterized protein FDP41_012935 [Naegleria fowleri]KAF0981147.1 hypothetical protein FDP41_012935 [Naegleria fowleri]CAG4717132.1 unnamed protein product [Naegleria fowleri]
MSHNHHHHHHCGSCCSEAQQGDFQGDDHHHCEHDHGSHDKNELEGFQQTLFPYIDKIHVRCMNEHKQDACQSIIRPYNERKSTNGYLESAVDSELLLIVPFTVSVNIKSFQIIGGDPMTCPDKVKIFKNNELLDIDSASQKKADQELDLTYDAEGTYDFLLKTSKFANVQSLTLFFPSNFSGENTRITYIGFKGEYSDYKRRAVQAIYEAAPQVTDHKVDALEDQWANAKKLGM